ncbi:uncharacterized protein LY89DRAFT_635605 [Mollisia scopiformis]|uniref:Uncharacterized protein n=1 Tax=Mollisia scopiformis TaxID=149040 RepID=A0A194XT66_MOLSC|nr:uncharacterized protein LY89DRAFT_635605 [Mollisia scopiformis]KUJ23341.1 hypothetical protein LY89DRAFT_635605 [Mollisia scopiformis]
MTLTNFEDDYNCPKKATLDSKGHCSSPIPNIPENAGCTAYCEIKLTPIFGQEIPFADGSCQSSTTCYMSTGQSVVVTNTYTVNVDVSINAGEDPLKTLTSAINIGATYSYSKSVGYETTEVHRMPLNATACGYWTFIPYLFNSCGTLTTAAIGETPAGYYNQDESPYCDKSSLSDVANYCNTTPHQDANGHADGKVIFVYTDCDTNIALPNGQDPAYWFPGVSTSHP